MDLTQKSERIALGNTLINEMLCRSGFEADIRKTAYDWSWQPCKHPTIAQYIDTFPLLDLLDLIETENPLLLYKERGIFITEQHRKNLQKDFLDHLQRCEHCLATALTQLAAMGIALRKPDPPPVVIPETPRELLEELTVEASEEELPWWQK